MKKIKSILQFAMRMEKDAMDFYSYYMDKAENETTRELFHQLAGIERHHYEVLKEKFDTLGYSEPPLTISWVVDDSFTSKDPGIISSEADTLPGEENLSGDLSIIRMAYLIESDFAEFYKHAVLAVEEPEAKEFLQQLSAWETQHQEMFHHRYVELLKKNWADIADILF